MRNVSRTPSASRVPGNPLGKASTVGWLIPELPRNDRLVRSAGKNYDVDPCVLTRPGRHHCRGAIRHELDLNKKMTRPQTAITKI